MNLALGAATKSLGPMAASLGAAALPGAASAAASGPSAAQFGNINEIAKNKLSHVAEKNLVSQRRFENFQKFLNSPALIVVLKYVIFILVLLLFFYMFFGGGGGGGGSRMRRRSQNKCKYSKGGCVRKIGPFTFGSKGGNGTSSPFDRFRTYEPNGYTMVQNRRTRALGRCDNERFVEMSGTRGLKDKNDPRNVCVDMQLVPNIEWTIDPAKNNPEWTKLPTGLRHLISKFNIIVIPFKIDGNVMHPDCSHAYYKQDPRKRPVVFLKDNGATCKVRDIEPTEYYERMRHKDSELDDWSAVEFVDCKETGQCGRQTDAN